MSEKARKKMGAGYADELNRGKSGLEALLGQLPEQDEEYHDLLLLTEKLQETLVPVQPSPTFVKNLFQRLVAAHREGPVQRISKTRRGVVLGAAAVGSILSIIGVMAYLIKSRMNPKAQAVGSA